MNQIPTIATILSRIQSWAQDRAPDVTFRPPAKPAAVDGFEHKTDLAVPESLRQVLLLIDGETRRSAGMIGNWRLMPIAEIQAAWGLLNKLDEKGAFIDHAPKASPYIRKTWWHSAWIPIVASDMGDYFCLDTDPPEPERYGQMLMFLQNRPERPLIAGSLEAWLDRILRDLESGLYHYDPKAGFNGEALLWSALEGKYLLDDIQGTLIANA